MSDRNHCPSCGRFTGDGWSDGDGRDRVIESPGFWDYGLHVPGPDGACDEDAEQTEAAACFCDAECAARWHSSPERRCAY